MITWAVMLGAGRGAGARRPTARRSMEWGVLPEDMSTRRSSVGIH